MSLYGRNDFSLKFAKIELQTSLPISLMIFFEFILAPVNLPKIWSHLSEFIPLSLSFLMVSR